MSIHLHPATEHLDVLIIGAGLSGIGCGYYLQRDMPDKSYAVLEARGASGGTWDLFRYPGLRSDSDLNTFGYDFKPWQGREAIARGKPILDYLRSTAAEFGIDRKIRYNHKVIQADWSSAQARWHVEVELVDTGERKTLTTNWLFSAAGYYRYDQGYAPEFPGVERFKGPVVHPQHWPEKLDYAGKKVVIIGSGATAVTMVPAMAGTAAHVTMLQRTPSYVTNLPSVDWIANLLRRFLPSKVAHAITKRKNVSAELYFWRFSKRFPKAARALLRYGVKAELPKGYPVDVHFNPPYNPWDQRLCLVPDGDLFKSLSAGTSSMVTDHIETFTETGLLLKSGKKLDADIIVTATGLNVQLFGGLKTSIDGVPVDYTTKVAFRGMMLSDIPNFAFAMGYTNASWTLKVNLVSEHFCRILGLMKERGYTVCCAKVPSPDMPTRDFLDFGAGYVQRAKHLQPRQGYKAPWLMPMYYFTDVKMLRRGPIEDPGLHFSSPRTEAFTEQTKTPMRLRAGT
jgi:monooxygenase